MKRKHVVHLTSAHDRFDTRIFVKMCSSLAKAGYKVTLVASDGGGSEYRNGVHIIGLPKARSRVSRMTRSVLAVYRKASSLNADVYHLHDPELLLVGYLLQRKMRKVIFDAHEDVPKQILGKHYLSPVMKFVLSRCIGFVEKVISARFSAVVCATPFIRTKFSRYNKNCVDIKNYPITDEFYALPDRPRRSNAIVYVGAISRNRGVLELVQSLDNLQSIRLNLAGRFSGENLRESLEGLVSWGKVNELGYLDRAEVIEVMNDSFAGVVTLHPIVNYLDSLPIKMFEYMAAGLPIIASNFPQWIQILEKYNCGIAVDPLDPAAIESAILFLSENPEKARLMGINGFLAVNKELNWAREEQKLIDLYKQLLET